jgi:dihydropteroate synthase
MGILNVTPDSFSDGGEFLTLSRAIEHAQQMIADGADLIDVGGESTRPGANPVSESEEIARTVPVVSELARLGISVSIDTMKPNVAAAALDAGAFLVNDVSGLRDPQMRALVQERKPAVCIMHMQGEPRTMQASPGYGDVVGEVRDYLLKMAEGLDLPRDQIWLDPGIGFGKTVEHNLTLIRRLEEFVSLGHPVLIGVSRKAFIGKTLGSEANPLPTEERLEGSLAAQVYAQVKGARVLRVHDVRAAARSIKMVAAIQGSDWPKS